MTTVGGVAKIAALLGDQARAAMLQALIDGRALAAGELASVAGITAPTASGHLSKLIEAKLVAVEAQGRHRYHRLAGPEVARLLEGLMLIASDAADARPRTGPRDPALRRARTCYDHLAGRLGVGIADAFRARGWIETDEEAAKVTAAGLDGLSRLGIAIDTTPTKRRGPPLCRMCLDWSERRPHIAGRLGAAICRHGFSAGWIRRLPESRAVEVTPIGKRAYREAFGVDVFVD